jgi:stage II sporulation protein D
VSRPRALAAGLVALCGGTLAIAGCGAGGGAAGKEPRPFPPGGPKVRVEVLSGQRVWVSIPGLAGFPAVFCAREGQLAVERPEGEPDASVATGATLALGPAGSGEPFAVAAGDARAARRYRGTLELECAGGGSCVRAVNSVTLEEYLLGVVGAEMPPLYPLEALKAQAVASRTYALHAMQAGREEPVISATASFQVYRGVEAEHARVRQAVESTRGEVLVHDGRALRAYFHSTCGGRTASAGDVFGDAAIPPLAGAECDGCAGSARARWDLVLSRELIEAAIGRRLEAARERGAPAVGRLRLAELEVAEKTADGRARYVRVVHESGSFEWRADAFRAAVEAVRPGTLLSTAFTVEREGDESWRVRGRGWGHGVGMCQVGAAGLARRGLGYSEIVARYFPGSERVREY